MLRIEVESRLKISFETHMSSMCFEACASGIPQSGHSLPTHRLRSEAQAHMPLLRSRMIGWGGVADVQYAIIDDAWAGVIDNERGMMDG
jgi:hypothetical protein